VTNDLVARFDEDYLKKWKKQYDVIILDFGAGEGHLNVQLSELLDKICIVMNPDEVSRQVVRTKLRFLFQKCILDKIICCVNILTQQKIAIGSGTLFNDFPGFMYSEDYARLYKRGNMIERSDKELWKRLSSIVKNIYEDTNSVLANSAE
jgi:cellulose biosynthesis protein BcsQ